MLTESLPVAERIRITNVLLVNVRRSLTECRWAKLHDHPMTRRLRARERELLARLKVLQKQAGGRT